MAAPSVDALAALARRAGEGDRAATAELLRKVGPSMMRSLRRMTGSNDVDDLLQESMIALTTALRGFRGESSVERYATRVAVRTALGLRRRARERKSLLDEHVRESEPLEDGAAASAAEEARANARPCVRASRPIRSCRASSRSPNERHPSR